MTQSHNHEVLKACCPFCGNEETAIEECDDFEATRRFCTKCGACGPFVDGHGKKERAEADRLWNTRPSPSPTTERELIVEQYDAGLLNDYGGGDVSWWHDYIRALLGDAHDFYAERSAAHLTQAAPVMKGEGEDPETCPMCGLTQCEHMLHDAATPPVLDLEKRAREYLAAEYLRSGYCNNAEAIRLGKPTFDESVALRAIVSALKDIPRA